MRFQGRLEPTEGNEPVDQEPCDCWRKRYERNAHPPSFHQGITGSLRLLAALCEGLPRKEGAGVAPLSLLVDARLMRRGAGLSGAP